MLHVDYNFLQLRAYTERAKSPKCYSHTKLLWNSINNSNKSQQCESFRCATNSFNIFNSCTDTTTPPHLCQRKTNLSHAVKLLIYIFVIIIGLWRQRGRVSGIFICGDIAAAAGIFDALKGVLIWQHRSRVQSACPSSLSSHCSSPLVFKSSLSVCFLFLLAITIHNK